MVNKANTGERAAQDATASATDDGPDYTILEDDSASGLSSKVNTLLRRGWEPVGGVTVATVHPDNEEQEEVWAQAMIKRS